MHNYYGGLLFFVMGGACLGCDRIVAKLMKEFDMLLLFVLFKNPPQDLHKPRSRRRGTQVPRIGEDKIAMNFLYKTYNAW